MTPEIFRETWKLQFEIATRNRRKRALRGFLFMLLLAGAYVLAYLMEAIRYPNTLFMTGLVGLYFLRESARTGSYFWDRMHHYGWIRENEEEELAKEVKFRLNQDGFELYRGEYDIIYRWEAFAIYFEEGGYLWLLDEKKEMVYVLSEAEIPGEWKAFREGVLANVEEGEAAEMKL